MMIHSIGWALSACSFLLLPSSHTTCIAFTPTNIAYQTSSHQQSPSSLVPLAQSTLKEPNDTPSTPSTTSSLDKRSTLTLLEHINLNVPTHDYILDFYLHILGMGLDPRYDIPTNVINGSGMVWANCGATQFHLVYGEEAQVVPGSIGLWYEELDGLKERLLRVDEGEGEERPFETYSIDVDVRTNQESIRIVDRYGNVFYCRQHSRSAADDNDDDPTELIRAVRQPTLTSTDTRTSQDYQSSDILQRFAMDDDQPDTNCRGIQYVEFYVPPNTAAQIAEFYDCVFDAPTNLLTIPSTTDDDDEDSTTTTTTNIAIIGLGSIHPTTGQTSQSLLFRETTAPLPPYDGHHIALYVGDDTADFAAAFQSCMDAGVVWVNPRYEDRVTNLNTAKKWNQFRFKDIVDLQTVKTVFVLEHEVRSVGHRGWTGLVGR